MCWQFRLEDFLLSRESFQAKSWFMIEQNLKATQVTFLYSCLQFQSWTPQLLLTPLRQMPANKWVNVFWCSMLVIAPVYLGTVLQVSCCQGVPGQGGSGVGEAAE